MKRAILLILIGIILPVANCGSGAEVPKEVDSRTELLANAESWHYQLQNVDIQTLGSSTSDLIVIDRCNDDGNPFTGGEVLLLKGTDGKRLVLCYLSIGEAEDYRGYWEEEWYENPPEWLGEENPDWEGNFQVKYWIEAWQDLVIADALAAQKAGFDGLYLDRVDAYEYWNEEVPGSDKLPISEAAALMSDFVSRIAGETRKSGGNDFLIVPQNAALLPRDIEAGAEKYYGVINAIGVEDVFFYGEKDEDNVWNPQEDVIDMLREYLERGKKVLSVEYLTHGQLIEKYLEAVFEEGYVGYVSERRELDS